MSRSWTYVILAQITLIVNQNEETASIVYLQDQIKFHVAYSLCKQNFIYVDVIISSSKVNALRLFRCYNPNGKNRVEISVLGTNFQRKIAGVKQLYLLYRIRWNIELFNKVEKSGSNL